MGIPLGNDKMWNQALGRSQAGLTVPSKLMRGTATWEVFLLEETPSSLLVYLPFSHSQCPGRPDSLGCF